MQDISEILKLQMTEQNCSPLCAFLIVEGDNYESLQPTKQYRNIDVINRQSKPIIK